MTVSKSVAAANAGVRFAKPSGERDAERGPQHTIRGAENYVQHVGLSTRLNRISAVALETPTPQLDPVLGPKGAAMAAQQLP